MISRSTTPVHDESHPLSPNQIPSSPTALLSSTSTPLLQPGSPVSPSPTSPPAALNPFARPTRSSRLGFSHSQPVADSQPGSVVLQRLGDASTSPSSVGRDSYLARQSSYDDKRDSVLLPPHPQFDRSGRVSRSSTFSTGVFSSRSSIISLSSDSKYPFIGTGVLKGANLRDSTYSSAPFYPLKQGQGLVPYEYDPGAEDIETPEDEEDFLHDPAVKGKFGNSFPWRGIANLGVLMFLITLLLCLFIFYPVFTFFRNEKVNNAIDGNIKINSTGQAPVLFGVPSIIDPATPDSAKTRTGYDGNSYSLVFSDEFEIAGRTFYPGDDPYWEAVDLWYGATADLEWYDPQQVTTRGGSLIITMDSADVTTSGGTPNSTAPFTTAQNHNQTYRSGMLQSWNKFCFTSGYIEVAVVLPGPNQDTEGYWPGIWTMGNIGRPGYGGSTDGTWPYTYDSCDVGTFPNQTYLNQTGPAAALHSDWSKSKYNFELSWLTGQKLSSCSCPSSDHPGPIKSDGTYTGRGAPEIDILEAEINKLTLAGQVVSQSAQFAPFTHDYVYVNDTSDAWYITNSTLSWANTYTGSPVQQAVSGLTEVPSGGFDGSGQTYVVYGFEYWSDPSDPSAGYIQWVTNGQPSVRMGASALPADPIDAPIGAAGSGSGGSGVSQRLIPVEPMSIILNLGISNNWETIDLTTMTFPTEMLVDYVRVYQRDGQQNLGCDPEAFPTQSYINTHMDAYTNPNYTTWPYDKPKNSQYDGC